MTGKRFAGDYPYADERARKKLKAAKKQVKRRRRLPDRHRSWKIIIAIGLVVGGLAAAAIVTVELTEESDQYLRVRGNEPQELVVAQGNPGNRSTDQLFGAGGSASSGGGKTPSSQGARERTASEARPDRAERERHARAERDRRERAERAERERAERERRARASAAGSAGAAPPPAATTPNGPFSAIHVPTAGAAATALGAVAAAAGAADGDERLLLQLLAAPDVTNDERANVKLRWVDGYRNVDIIALFAPGDVSAAPLNPARWQRPLPPDPVRWVNAQFTSRYKTKPSGETGTAPFFATERDRVFSFSYKVKSTDKPLKMPIYFVGSRFSAAELRPVDADFSADRVQYGSEHYKEVALRAVRVGVAEKAGATFRKLDDRDIERRIINDPQRIVSYATLICDGRCDDHWPAGVTRVAGEWSAPAAEPAAPAKPAEAPPELPPGIEIEFIESNRTITDKARLETLVKTHPFARCLTNYGIGLDIEASAPGSRVHFLVADKYETACDKLGVTHKSEDRLAQVDLALYPVGDAASAAVGPADPLGIEWPKQTSPADAALVDWRTLGAPACLEQLPQFQRALAEREQKMQGIADNYAAAQSRIAANHDPCAAGANPEQDLADEKLLRTALGRNEQAIGELRRCFDAVDRWLTEAPPCDHPSRCPAALRAAARFLIDEANALDRRLEQLTRRHYDLMLSAASLRRRAAVSIGYCGYAR
jgi:hypothetical protein